MTYPLSGVKVPEPNQALAAVLRSGEIRSAVHEVAELGQALYREDVAKRTGRLAASAHVSTEFAHVLKGEDRWIGVLTVGGAGGAGTVFYALAHEFGVGDHPESREGAADHPAADDLQRVLELLSVAGHL